MFHLLFTKIDSISTSELEAKLREPIQLLDVRTPMEFRRGHIKNAKNVPLTEIGSYTPTTKETLYVICHSGVRSKLAAKKLKKKGYDVINVRGGMSAWTGKVIQKYKIGYVALNLIEGLSDNIQWYPLEDNLTKGKNS